jgi:hypothetical protein
VVVGTVSWSGEQATAHVNLDLESPKTIYFNSMFAHTARPAIDSFTTHIMVTYNTSWNSREISGAFEIYVGKIEIS